MKKTYQIGDSITLRIEIPQDIYDETNGDIVDIRNWNYNTDVTFFLIEDGNLFLSNHLMGYKSKIGNFDIINHSTEIWSVICDFKILNNVRVFEGTIFFNEIGLYSFSFSHILDELILSDCPNRRIFLHYNLNEGEDNNYQLIVDDEIQKEITNEELKQYGGYVFEVKE